MNRLYTLLAHLKIKKDDIRKCSVDESTEDMHIIFALLSKSNELCIAIKPQTEINKLLHMFDEQTKQHLSTACEIKKKDIKNMYVAIFVHHGHPTIVFADYYDSLDQY